MTRKTLIALIPLTLSLVGCNVNDSFCKGVDTLYEVTNTRGAGQCTRTIHGAPSWSEHRARTKKRVSIATKKSHRPSSIETLIRRKAAKAGVDPNVAVAIAKCESSLNPRARNKEGSTAKGLYQFTDPTWKHIKARGHQFDANENIDQFMKWYPKKPNWWECHKLVQKRGLLASL